jgi:hypothetical protein
MKRLDLLKLALLAGLIPFFAGCVTREVVYRPAPAPVPTAVVATDPAPPPTQVEVIPQVPGDPNVWVWVPGEWVWRGHWVWRGGRWAARPYVGAVWIHGGWGWRGHRRIWVGAHWQ